MKKSILPIFLSHQGCPHQCVFCDQTKIAGEAVSPDAIVTLIEEGLCACTPAIPQVAFYGGSFTALPEDLQEAYLQAVQPYLQSGRVSGIRLSTRPDAIDDRIIQRLKSAGVVEVELGAQSMDDVVLRASGRGHTAEDTRIAARKLKDAGFSLVLQMMVGLPQEKDPMDTARELIALSPDAVRIYPVAVVRGTPLEKLWNRGEYTALKLSQGVELCARLWEMFAKHGISVIRMGLHPSEALEVSVCDGVYHPAFGELVHAERYYQKARTLLQGLSGTVTLLVHPSRVSCMIGQKRKNIQKLEEEFPVKICVKQAVIPEEEIKIEREA